MNPSQSVFITIFHRLTLISAYKVKLGDVLIGILMKTPGIAFVGSLFALTALTAQPVSAETSMESPAIKTGYALIDMLSIASKLMDLTKQPIDSNHEPLAAIPSLHRYLLVFSYVLRAN